MIGNQNGVVEISPDQALRIMAIAEMLRDGDLELRGEDVGDVETARAALIDVSQEIALQVHQ